MDEMQKQSALEANTKLEKLQLIEHWNNPVIVLMPKKDEFFMDGNLEIFLTVEAFGERLKAIEGEGKYVYSKIPVVLAIDTVCKKECKGMLIRGLAEEEIYITKEELMPLANEADTIIMLQAVKGKQITEKRAVQLLQDREFYILGDMPNVLAKQEDFFSFDMARIQGKSFDAVKLYMTRERAEKYNVRNFDINCYTFHDLAKHFRNSYGLVIEPQQGFSVAFAPNEI